MIYVVHNEVQFSDNLDLILVITSMLISKTQQNEMLERKAQSGKVLIISVLVFNATLNNISAISWQSVLLVGKPECSEKTIDLSQVTDKKVLMVIMMSS